MLQGAACKTYDDTPVATPPKLGDVPPDLQEVHDCHDPGVGPINTVSEAVNVIGANRIFAACNTKKFRDMRQHYRNVRAVMMGPQ
jgi:hypothetical protein